MTGNLSAFADDLIASLQGRAFGLITADQPSGHAAQNRARTRAMAFEPRPGLGLLILEARPCETSHLNDPDHAELTLLLIGPEGDDDGLVKGVLRLWGRRYDQRVALWKLHDSDQLQLLSLRSVAQGDASAVPLVSLRFDQLGEAHASLRGRMYDPAAWALSLRTLPAFFSRSPAVLSSAAGGR